MSLALKSDMNSFGILGSSSAFPDEYGRWIENEEIHEIKYGTQWRDAFREKGYDEAYIQKKHGFEKRYWVHTPGTPLKAGQATSVDLMVFAARGALENARLAPEAIDLLIAFTTTSPRYTSSIAAISAGRLELRCAAMEIRSGCSSAIYGLVLAYQFLVQGARNILLVGGDTLSKITDPNSSLLYATGDGGAALVVGRVEEATRGLQVALLDADGSFSNTMGVPVLLPPPAVLPEQGDYTMRMDPSIEDFLFEKWRQVPPELYDLGGLTPDDIDLYIPHQARRDFTRTGAAAAGVSSERVADYIPEFANCGPCGLMAALDRSRREGRIGAGSRLMLQAVGGGIAWGGIILTA